MGGDWVAITDNADPMNVVVYRSAREVSGGRDGLPSSLSSARARPPPTSR